MHRRVFTTVAFMALLFAYDGSVDTEEPGIAMQDLRRRVAGLEGEMVSAGLLMGIVWEGFWDEGLG